MGQVVVALMTLVASSIAATVIFDCGISTQATISASTHKSDGLNLSSAVFLRQAEMLYWMIGGAICALALVLFIFMPRNWIWQLLNEDTTLSFAVGSVLLIVLQILYGWLQNYYLAVLVGLQAIRKICISQLILSVLRLLLVACCVLLTKSLFLVLLSHLICTMAQVFYSRHLFNGYISKLNEKLTPSKVFRNIEGLIDKNLAVIGALAIFLTYADKIWLGLISSPEQYAAYSVAAMLASGLYLIISPIYTNLVPYFAKVLTKNDGKELKFVYTFATEIMTLLLVPSGMILIFFADEILNLWLGNASASVQAARALPWLVAGVLANAFLTVAYALQVAAGWTKLALHVNLVASIFILPSLWISFTVFGIIGAAINWALLNAILLIVWPALMHKKMIPHFMMYWLLKHILMPCAVVACVVASLSIQLSQLGLGGVAQMLFIALTYALACTVVALISSTLRQRIWNKLSSILN
jgi:O-antigen/teichoic acid export membrane protein